MKAKDAITQARFQLVIFFPFFGILALRLKLIEDEGGGGGRTMGVTVDKKLYYNPKFVDYMMEGKSPEEGIRNVAIVLCHEIMHLVQRCHDRFPLGGDHKVWNIAADFAVNSALSKMQLCANKKTILDEVFPHQVRDYAEGKSTEEMYFDLMNGDFQAPEMSCIWEKMLGGGGKERGPGEEEGEEDQNGKGCSGRDKRNGLGCSVGSGTKDATEQEIQDLIENIQSAAAAAQSRGDLPGIIGEFLARLSKPTVTWKDHLRRMAVQTFRGNYTWNRPSRRSEALHIRLPARKPTAKGATIILDTSGSISDEMLNQFLSETVGIMNACQCSWVDVYLHDVTCYLQETYTKETITKVQVKRGGTSHIDVFQKIEESKKKVGIAIAFTDLETCFPDKAPKFPVIWAVPSRYMGHSIPWGKKVEVQI